MSLYTLNQVVLTQVLNHAIAICSQEEHLLVLIS